MSSPVSIVGARNARRLLVPDAARGVRHAPARRMQRPQGRPARQWAQGAVLAVLFALGGPATATDEPTGRAASEQHTRIVGGEEAEADAWPWQVALVEPDGPGFVHFCGGSVIAPQWVLTAAHCVDGVFADQVQVLVGTNDLDEGGRRIDVSAIRMHEDFRGASTGSDIALLKLAEPADVEAIALPDTEYSDEIATPGDTATVTGWGLLRPLHCTPGSRPGSHQCQPRGGESGHFVDALTGRPVDLADVLTSRLMEVEVPLVGEETCRRAYPRAAIDRGTLCAGLRRGGRDSCQGDSGGPLVVHDGDRRVQAGIVSWGSGCAKPGKYGVYTNVGAYADWVEDETGLELAMAGAEAPSAESPSSPTSSEPSPPTTTPAPPRGDRALLVGINRYANPDFDLYGAVHDAHNMQELLTGHLGFNADQIRLLTDEQATRDAILTGIRDWLVAGTLPDSRALFYFAGHGYYREDENGDEPDGVDEALVPHDARFVAAGSGMARMENLIIDDEIGALFEELRDRLAYLIADSCHAGTITRSLGVDPRVVRTIDLRLDRARRPAGSRAARPADGGTTGFVESGDSLVAWTAVSASQLALEDVDAPHRQGVFTRRFVRGVAERLADRNDDGRVVHAELLDYVRKHSDSYCTAHPKDCGLGLTPLLEGPPGILAREVMVAGASTGQTPGTVADSALGHDNSAGVRLEILPSTTLRVGQEVKYRLRSERSGHLLIVDVGTDGEVTQIFPNFRSEELGVGTEIAAGRAVVIPPNAYYGFRFTIRPPVGRGSLFAIVTEDPVSLDDLTAPHRNLDPVPDGRSWLLALGERLRKPWTVRGDGEGMAQWSTREAQWSMARVEYEIEQ